ncbi:hypothetical protein DQ384_36370 [Sphaerisporangium album]|uniref:Uncharacterized protein n=1 Tax=Sphaerisporangium album TaxID=509200 RepID=A0A367EUZ5_9ACTN|nr:hypothetical protein [Sphaerisporangium album]RCG21938.1 hypothetical protein DQ384_36370 [Sphaerisporangium album]
MATTAEVLRNAANLISTQHPTQASAVTAIRLAAGLGGRANDLANGTLLVLARHLHYGDVEEGNPQRFAQSERHLERWSTITRPEEMVSELRRAADVVAESVLPAADRILAAVAETLIQLGDVSHGRVIMAAAVLASRHELTPREVAEMAAADSHSEVARAAWAEGKRLLAAADAYGEALPDPHATYKPQPDPGACPVSPADGG